MSSGVSAQQASQTPSRGPADEGSSASIRASDGRGGQPKRLRSREAIARSRGLALAAPGSPKAHDLWPSVGGQAALISACAYVDSQGMDEITILQAEVLKTLASPRRLEILHVLARGPIEVGRLAEAIGATQPNVSQHLAMLRGAGVVEAERDGREVRYRLADPDVMVACGVMRGVLERRLRRLADLSTASDIPTESAATRQPATTGA
jgi:DNA-binding transcriptional ArsR family regulator